MPPRDPKTSSRPFSEILGYEAAFYSLPDPVFIYDHSSRKIINANEAAVRRYGYAAEAFREMGPWDIEAPYDESQLAPKIDRLKERGSAVYQTEHRTADGQRFPAEVHTIYRNFNGTDIFVAICREITERLKSEERLRKAESHYRAIFQNVVNLICVADLKTATFIDINPAFERLLGHKREELINRSVLEFVHPEDAERTRKIASELLSNGLPAVSFQNRYRCRNGDYVWLDWSSQPLGDQGLVYAVARDISEQKAIEERLHEQNQRMRLHVEQTPLGVVEWDLDFRVTAWNHGAERIFGYQAEEAMGQPGTFILPPDIHDQVNEVWTQLISQAGGNRSVNKNVHKNGDERTCEWHNTPLVDEKGRIVGVASLVLDVTEQEIRKRELERAKEAAEKADRAKSDFLSMMSHELRTPLNSIIGPCEIIKQLNDNPSVTPLLDGMLSSSSHLLDLINSILDLAKIESGSLEVTLSEFPADSFFTQRLLPLRNSAERKGLAFRLENKLPAGTILKTDSRLLLQSLFNLVGNAVKFTESGSVSVTVENEGSLLRIEIIDTGPGIPEDLQPLLFQPFRHGRDSLSKSQRGSGLGLSITKQIVETLGGSITFSSRVAKGSAFSLILPDAALPAKAPPPSQPDDARKRETVAQRRKILLVEDEPSNQAVTAALLKFLGYTHDLATSGEQAISLWEAHRHPVVLMDVKLPRMDGIEACQRIKALAGSTPVVVIAQSAYALSEQREAFLQEGMDDYVSKPIAPHALRNCIENAFRRLEVPTRTES